MKDPAARSGRRRRSDASASTCSLREDGYRRGGVESVPARLLRRRAGSSRQALCASLPSVDRGAAAPTRRRWRSSASDVRRPSRRSARRSIDARARLARNGSPAPDCATIVAAVVARATRRRRRAAACGRSSTSPARCCTPISAARCLPRRPIEAAVDAMRGAVALEFDLANGRARRARRSSARPALRADRRRGRHRRQQQCRRRAARAQHAWRRAARRSCRAAS